METTPPGHIKINIDGAWIKETKFTDVCALARDCNGSMIDGSTRLCVSGSSLEAEARASLEAVELSERIPHVPILLESDSKYLVDSINNISSNCHWRIAPIISKIKNDITLLHRSTWFWVPREANPAADLVALLVVQKKCSDVWIDRPPSSLVFVLSRDGLPYPLPPNPNCGPS
ncbi:uncharacterized protein LOC126796898 [Argentina anserina]|uniref:uncharacterized protein LOC126796898 n=1 Tax=Argentina anserina TaxID=57926 RepID=UPI002176647F|nr:uncharacterized protein LOC126796898 [Potentilla anserina]